MRFRVGCSNGGRRDESSGRAGSPAFCRYALFRPSLQGCRNTRAGSPPPRCSTPRTTVGAPRPLGFARTFSCGRSRLGFVLAFARIVLRGRRQQLGFVSARGASGASYGRRGTPPRRRRWQRCGQRARKLPVAHPPATGFALRRHPSQRRRVTKEGKRERRREDPVASGPLGHRQVEPAEMGLLRRGHVRVGVDLIQDVRRQ
jgi:hypothetical protein